MCSMNASLSMILKFFLNFGRFEPCDSYKLYSYKKESVYFDYIAHVSRRATVSLKVKKIFHIYLANILLKTIYLHKIVMKKTTSS